MALSCGHTLPLAGRDFHLSRDIHDRKQTGVALAGHSVGAFAATRVHPIPDLVRQCNCPHGILCATGRPIGDGTKACVICQYNPANPYMVKRLEESLEIQLGRLLRRHGLKLATAESCTGGLIADKITDVPGSSEYFLGGFVSYAYEAKVASLGVSWDTLKLYGAVSRETVLEMARGARHGLNADLAVSVSGIAGPGGGMPGKPVGTTWIGLVAPDEERAQVFYWRGDRRENKESSAQAALKMVVDFLKEWENRNLTSP